MIMVLNYELITALGTLNSYQLRLLGIGWPPRRGWIYHLVGQEITDDMFRILVEPKGPRKKAERIQILKRHGISPSKLFQSKIKYERTV